MAVVNWQELANSIEWWQRDRMGFVYREVPWTVPDFYTMATCPSEEFLVNSKLGSHVGSAEQSFIYLDHIGALGRGRWLACTPCFRTEVLDDTHQSGFMKVELYQNDIVDESSLNSMVENALMWFRTALVRHGHEPKNAEVISTRDGFDIEIGGIEVGSYGIRQFEHIAWVYGTALAEPRFSTAMIKLNDF